MITQIVLFAITSACVSGLNFTDCGSTSTIHALRVQGCTVTPCIFRRGQKYIIEMDITAKTESNALPLTITGQPTFLPPITILTGNACTMLSQGSCPTVPGSLFTAHIPYTVGKWLPTINLSAQFLVRDDAGGSPVCGRIPVRITD